MTHGHAARHPGIASTAAPLAAIAAVEALACDSVVTTRAHGDEVTLVVAQSGLNARAVEVNVVVADTAIEALQRAVTLASGGARTAVVLGGDELLGGLSELKHAVARHAPLVVHVLERPSGGARAGRDELAPALEVGAGVVVSGTAQQGVDLALAIRRAAEDSELPFLHLVDAPAREVALALPERALVETFLGPPPSPKPPAPPPTRADAKRDERAFAARAPFALQSAFRELGEWTGRTLRAVDRGNTGDVEEVIVAVGGAVEPAGHAVEQLRREGGRVGLVSIVALRPFFAAEAVKAVSRAHAVLVLEPLDVALAPSGPVATALKAAFADAITWTPGFPGVGKVPPTISATVATLERPIGEEEIRALLAELEDGERARRVIVFGTTSDDARPKPSPKLPR